MFQSSPKPCSLDHHSPASLNIAETPKALVSIAEVEKKESSTYGATALVDFGIGKAEGVRSMQSTACKGEGLWDNS